MKWTVKPVAEVVSGNPIEHEIATIERAEEISPASVGLTIAEGKALLASLQEQIVTAQVEQHMAGSDIVLIAEWHYERKAIISPHYVLYTVA